jgi:hypothetical protein
MEYTTQEDLDTYLNTYMTRRCDIVYNQFDKKAMIFYDLVIDYNIRVMEKDIEELYEMFEDKKNVINLVTFYDKKNMNYDLLMIIYNNIVSANGNIKYKHLMIELGKSNRFESIAKIMAA